MLLVHLSDVNEADWISRLAALLGDYPIVSRNDRFNPDDIRYVFVWKPLENAFEGLNNLKAILSLGAGVDALLRHPNLPRSVPIVRFVEDDLTRCMSDYVVANVTMHHRCFTRYRRDQRARNWSQYYPPAARNTCVGIMGMGVLGQDAAKRLLALGFEVRGWSRSPKDMQGVESFSGPDQFEKFLGGTDILVDLLPLTPETENILNYEMFLKLRRGRLRDGPVIINAARGGHQVEADIVRALGDGTLGAASLDVFQTEPLPPDSPLWELDNCYITPHIAAISSPQSGAAYFANVVLDHEAGKPLLNVVDVERGY
ncbi:MAG TPA: glyoxylate/hydroxypyruvate reductase A [Devosia sp.]|nr:glyoxylate/hydroxypyruvate reductase A [Devosia sp.]